MALTRAFRETIVARAERYRHFCQSMLTEAINELLSGDVEAGKFLLRDYINATITFDGFAAAPDKPSKSLQRMFGAHAKPLQKAKRQLKSWTKCVPRLPHCWGYGEALISAQQNHALAARSGVSAAALI